jgi:DNA-binding response OmpR family regulator
MPLVLIVDDDPMFRRLLRFHLDANRYHCQEAVSALDTLKLFAAGIKPDIVLLDYFLGDGSANGLELCAKIKALSNVPVMMLTANAQTQTIVSCLDAGADQYVVKPYVTEELLARMRTLLRRESEVESNSDMTTIMQCGELSLDPFSRRLRSSHRVVQLSEKECAMLRELMKVAPKAADRDTLSNVIYERPYDSETRVIDVLVGRVRKKLEEVSKGFVIRPVRGRGYALQPAAASGHRKRKGTV